jgi:hypothetical protein
VKRLDARAHPRLRREVGWAEGGKILPGHDYRNEGKRWCGLLLALVLFRLVAPPLQSGVVGPYLILGVWIPSCLPLEQTGRILNFGP